MQEKQINARPGIGRARRLNNDPFIALAKKIKI